MTQEQKAKAYDKALERARKLATDLPNGRNDRLYHVWDLETIFPELKESEDEQSKKWILEYLHDGLRKSDEQFKDHFKAAISWLEKQGEQKHAWSEEDEEMLQGIWDEILANKHDAKEYEWKTYDKFLDWLKSLRPQNRWKPSEEQIEAIEHFLRSIRESGYASPYENNTKLLYSLLEQLKKLKG